MKIVFNTCTADIINSFNRFLKVHKKSILDIDVRSIEVLSSRVEQGLFSHIGDNSVDAYIIETPTAYSQKAVDFIKKRTPYVPVIVFGTWDQLIKISGADIYMPFLPEMEENELFGFYELNIKAIGNFRNNFSKLRKLTTKISEVIEFGECKFDPTRRILYYKGEEVKKLSAKEGGILEVLASNYGEVVKKEIILEKVWHNTDYFTSRSMDVYITHLRKLLRTNGIDITIKNISGVGLILE